MKIKQRWTAILFFLGIMGILDTLFLFERVFCGRKILDF